MSEPQDPTLAPRPPVVSVNRRPLYAVGVAVLFVLFVLFAYLNPKPSPPPEAPKGASPAPADPNSLLGRFLAEQESRARRQPPAPPAPSWPSAPPADALPQAAAKPPLPRGPIASPEELPPPGVYDPRWPAVLARGTAGAEFPREKMAPASPDRPVIRFRAGEKAAAPSGDPLTDALVRLLPKAPEEVGSGATARTAEPVRLAPESRESPPARAEAFLAARAASVPSRLAPAETLRSPFRLLQGSLIPATLETALNSDLPGMATALVRRDVYDSPTGSFLLVPRGARLVGQYSSDVQHGDSRLLLAWTRLLLPDGTAYDLSRLSAADLEGAAGVPAKVDSHLPRLFTTAFLLSVISAGAQLSQAPAGSDLRGNPTASEIAAGALGQELGQVSSGLLRRGLDVRPSLRLAAGTPFNVQVASDLEFPRPYLSGRP
ncbi:MAG TPA: TrbI/VirB10 family protein [Thermoanaerobaculia bacterium]|nr:TrbI/VirB10 family protein [Thermoanaerobaculia bacterium]